jgi:hypothetical protein
MLNVAMLSVIMLSVITLSVVMLSVIVFFQLTSGQLACQSSGLCYKQRERKRLSLVQSERMNLRERKIEGQTERKREIKEQFCLFVLCPSISLSLKCILSDCTRDSLSLSAYNTGHWLAKKDYVYVCSRKLSCTTTASMKKKCVCMEEREREGGKRNVRET